MAGLGFVAASPALTQSNLSADLLSQGRRADTGSAFNLPMPFRSTIPM
jgi:hypothetical protein